MQLILLLTKNVLMEQGLQKQLQQLSYEVLCSAQALQHLRRKEFMMRDYCAVIFSETITNKEIIDVLPQLITANVAVFRKFSGPPTAEEQERLEMLGVSEWITEDVPLDQLRECLAEKMNQLQQTEEKQYAELYHSSVMTEKLQEQFIKLLTKKEQQLFLYLQANHGEIVPREELCGYLWNEPLSHSRMSQLSVLVKKIKEKLVEMGFNEDLLRTIWGRGYCLTSEFSIKFLE
ncbi:helix-turn-helix domain-containing protein [Enterococcus pallens]|uniref:OmpR/PhoB-type domain-containing protein n=2 Tax=Enterococcus pallens TaxID=160454 RepID=R2SI05_9ENTE|nr:helix-turn-helix domain-containing protein [Enterococcus pallens]EOH92461.1 hypothetical protein UAU_02913 [Enterococcus pallens ATCC BAA-351]EOU25046.1 hypothetical protein I588_01034 [Enterococcus pallens ATCC BAA-351]OJG70065.1 hypothetical protein RV10_GL000572 [Enterococcus pallens]